MVKIIFFILLLVLLGGTGCTHSGKTGMEGIALRENSLEEDWQGNRISTYEYLCSSIDLAREKSEIRFRQHKSLLTRYPKWVPGLHPRPDAKLRSSIVEAYAEGRISDSEYENLMKQTSVLLDRWGEQRRILTKERFKLGYPR